MDRREEGTDLEGGIRIVRARASGVEAVLSVLDEAARWLLSRGIDQWQPGASSRRHVVGWMERGELYLARMDGEPVGTVALVWSDEEIWGDVPEAAGYVHGLALRRDFAGQGLGRALLRWVENRVASSGREHLRLDCVAENRALNDYYERAGFRYRGRALVRGLEVSLYEKKVGIFGAG